MVTDSVRYGNGVTVPASPHSSLKRAFGIFHFKNEWSTDITYMALICHRGCVPSCRKMV